MGRNEHFTRALITSAAQGLRPQCSDSGTGAVWLSEDTAERAEAAQLCVGCPALAECAAAATARRETFGTWGGRDFVASVKSTLKSSTRA
jgi:hypothetical protein